MWPCQRKGAFRSKKIQLAVPAWIARSPLYNGARVLGLAFSLPEIVCRSVEDYCLEKDTDYCSPVAIRPVPVYKQDVAV